MIHAADHRVCFVGDSLVQGTGDEQYLGWPGRLAAQACARGYALTAYNLGVRRETSADIAARWLAECERRWPAGCEPYAVFSFGVNDCFFENGRTRVAPADSAENLRRILDAALRRCSVLVVGPPPVTDAEHAQRIAELSVEYEAACRRMGVLYIPVFAELNANEIWVREVAANDQYHPRAAAYQELATLIERSGHWWFDAQTGIRET